MNLTLPIYRFQHNLPFLSQLSVLIAASQSTILISHVSVMINVKNTVTVVKTTNKSVLQVIFGDIEKIPHYVINQI